jgi:glucuronokinase
MGSSGAAAAQAPPTAPPLDDHRSSSTATAIPVVSRVHARIGLLGNPSDGFYGKTVSLALANFYAEVTLTPRAPGSGIEFVPHPYNDKTRFASLDELAARVAAEGYYGGVRLLMVRA